ncbi:type ISP restriction/modification enzyme [Acinetobacter ursingii]|uniref:type ISP restriction/modification enzyme n=1 Tax=Acinetobacter ursingii TaxID=108980 RepID=UPI0035A259B6
MNMTNIPKHPCIDNIESNEPFVIATPEFPNLVICVSTGNSKPFSVLITDCTPDLHLVNNSQCFPHFLYEKVNP